MSTFVDIHRSGKIKMLALSKKPASSPSRPDNFPSPLMGFSRFGRSRGRFYTRRRRVNSARVMVETAREPSSPKVTCIGQVRSSRSAASRHRRPCRWVEKTRALFSGLRGKVAFGRWVNLFFRRSEKTEVAPGCNDGNAPSVPPVMFLTRCRSAPYKPSSLGGLFWGCSFENTVGAVLTRCNSEPARRGESVCGCGT